MILIVPTQCLFRMKAKLRLHPPSLPSIQIQPLFPLLLFRKLTLRKSVLSLNHTLRKLFEFANKFSSIIACKYCKKPCHSVERCYKLRGYPPSFRSMFKKTSTYAQVSYSKLMSHFDNFGGESSKRIQIDLGVHNFTKEHYEHLLSLIQQSKVSSASTEMGSGSANIAGLLGTTDLDLVVSLLAMYLG